MESGSDSSFSPLLAADTPLLSNALLCPYRLASLAVGIVLLIAGSVFLPSTDWDVGVCFAMALPTYVLAPWAFRQVFHSRWRWMPLAAMALWASIDGSYSLYWWLRRFDVLTSFRAANYVYCLPLFWICGFVWNIDLKKIKLRRVADSKSTGGRLERQVKIVPAVLLGVAMSLLIGFACGFFRVVGENRPGDRFPTRLHFELTIPSAGTSPQRTGTQEAPGGAVPDVVQRLPAEEWEGGMPVSEHARPEDWTPTPATAEYTARLKELDKRWKALDESFGKERAALQSFRESCKAFIMWVHGQERDGCFVNRGWSGIEWPTREAAHRSVIRYEYYALARWQQELPRYVENLIWFIRGHEEQLVAGRPNWQGRRDELMTAYGLTRYEWAFLQNNQEWQSFLYSTLRLRGVRGCHRAARGPGIASETLDDYARFAVDGTHPLADQLRQWVEFEPQRDEYDRVGAEQRPTKKTLALWVLVDSLYDLPDMGEAQWIQVWKVALDHRKEFCFAWILRQLVLERMLDDGERVYRIVSLCRPLAEESGDKDARAVLDALPRKSAASM